VFEIKAMHGALAPCVWHEGKPVAITDEGRILELALASNGWNPKIVKYNEGDNIIIDRKEKVSVKSNELLFTTREEVKKSTTVAIRLPDGYLGTYDIMVTQETGSTGSRLSALTMDTINTRTQLVLGMNENIVIDDYDVEVLIEAFGKQWTDIAAPWYDGKFKSIRFDFINKDKGNSTELLVGDGFINQSLLPKDVRVGNSFRLREDGLKLYVERLNEYGNWLRISEFG
jgi:hypothetical protein